MRTVIIKFATWLLKLMKCEVFYVKTKHLDEARRIVNKLDKYMPKEYGEAKRHKAYASMMDSFPNDKKRELAAAIEAALQ